MMTGHVFYWYRMKLSSIVVGLLYRFSHCIILRHSCAVVYVYFKIFMRFKMNSSILKNPSSPPAVHRCHLEDMSRPVFQGCLSQYDRCLSQRCGHKSNTVRYSSLIPVPLTVMMTVHNRGRHDVPWTLRCGQPR